MMPALTAASHPHSQTFNNEKLLFDLSYCEEKSKLKPDSNLFRLS